MNIILLREGLGYSLVAKFQKIEDWNPYDFKIDMDPVILKYATNMRDTLKQPPTPKGKNHRPHKYYETWHYTMKPKKHEAIVYNKENYRLTHLLENGHFIVNRKDGRLGWAAPQPHIQPAFDKIAPKFIEAMEKCKIVDNS